MKEGASDAAVREEFNRWAEAGRGEEMEEHHLPIVLPMLAMIDFAPADRILDVGCGTGWLCRRLAARAPQGAVAGLDVSDQMLRRARQASSGFPNLTFTAGVVDALPWTDHSFTKVVSVESAYYWPDPARGLAEIFRVLAPGGSAWILINYFRDNPYCHEWGALLSMPTQLLSTDEWETLFRDAGFARVAHQRIPDNSPSPDVYTGRWFKDAEQMRKFKQEGALLIRGGKPA